MSQSLIILGRQPELGIAELESLYGGTAVTPVDQAALLDYDPCVVDFERLGGAIKLCKVLTTLDTVNWRDMEAFLIKAAPDQAAKMPEGKMHLGLSVYGLNVPPKQLLATGLKLKKAIQSASTRSVRLVPNKTSELNTAQIIHHRLTGTNGWELVLVRDDTRTIIAQTVRVHDIDRYSERDFGRPKRDARIGMLPPKLAQLLINLATGPDEFAAIKDQLEVGTCLSETDEAKMRAERRHLTVLDPFCGTGVVLQEAVLMGYNASGSDLEPRMIDYSRQNLEWLGSRYSITPTYQLTPGDATIAQWPQPISLVASETYLGRPFTDTPPPEILAQTVSECNVILKKFLQNIYPQLTSGTRLCLAVPAWQTKPREFRHLSLVDQIAELGYNRVRFEHVRDADLLYYRPDQFVARELLVLTRK